ncbi:MAG TPA: hypothetical protein VNJ08_02450 [Bacteriovoracaceae bacterium]|nr:hypothetical protein [Bacteriovoracaceae bacterium]
MKFLLSLFISFQFMTASLAAELGQNKDLDLSTYLSRQLATAVAEDFESKVRSGLEEIQTKGLNKFISQHRLPLMKGDNALIKNHKVKETFVELKKGFWEAKVSGQTLSFSLSDLYNDTINVNGMPLNFKGKNLTQIQNDLAQMDQPKTSWFKNFFISEAEAGFPVGAVIIVAALIFVAVYTKHLYNKHVTKPRETALKFKQLTRDLYAQASVCENAGSSDEAYSSTYKSASDIGNSTQLKALTSPSDSLMLMIKTQIEQGNFNAEECFTSLQEDGEKLKLSVPDVKSQRFKQRRKLLSDPDIRYPSNDDSTDTLITLCNAYNRLSSCMGKFVGAHINGSDINNFEDRASKNFYQYQSRASKQ